MKDKRITFQADLHIHTPASKCFKDSKDDSTFFEILKEAKKKNLSIIAITDHNSIEGYKKLIELKEKIQEELIVLEEISDSELATKKRKVLKTQLNYFENLLIIPGIEFEVNNGIHLLCLFNPETNIQKIEEFLNAGGYSIEDYGFENANKISKWDIFQFFEESKTYDCIIIDAHTDSDKGILETIPKGNSRAHCFSNAVLRGVCYNSEKQRSLLEKTIKDSAEYQREIPMAFIKSSDSHKINDIGKSVTFFQLEDLNFDEFKKAFSNPLEYISTTIPAIKNIVRKILTTGKFLTIISLENNKLKESICAFNNSKGGYILLGVNELGGIDGFQDEKTDDVINYVEEAEKTLSHKINYEINAYPVQYGRFIVIINIKKGDKLIDINGDGVIYVFDSKGIKVLSADEIERAIEQRITSQLQNKILKRLTKIELESIEIKNSLFSFPVIQKFEQNSININKVVSELNLIEPLKLSKEQILTLKEYVSTKENGKSKGNIFYFRDLIEPRLNSAYLRISVPKYYLKGIENHTKKFVHIIGVPGGGTFYSTKKIEQYNKHGLGIFEFYSKNNNYSNKFIVSFLKSSFFLWYFNFKFDSIDFYNPKKFNKILFPIINLKNPEQRKHIENIEEMFDLIIEKENNFLMKNVRIENDDYAQIIDNHNQEVSEHYCEIDTNIYKLMKLNDDEIGIIESSLLANNIYVKNNFS